MIELVRATVNLPGLPHGTIVPVETNDPYVAMCLSKKLLVPVADDDQPSRPNPST